MRASAHPAATTASPAGDRLARSRPHAYREGFHAAQDHRIEPFQPSRGGLDVAPARQDRRQRNLALEAREREAEADVRSIAKREMGWTTPLEHDAIRFLVSARVAIRGIHH